MKRKKEYIFNPCIIAAPYQGALNLFISERKYLRAKLKGTNKRAKVPKSEAQRSLVFGKKLEEITKNYIQK